MADDKQPYQPPLAAGQLHGNTPQPNGRFKFKAYCDLYQEIYGWCLPVPDAPMNRLWLTEVSKPTPVSTPEPDPDAESLLARTIWRNAWHRPDPSAKNGRDASVLPPFSQTAAKPPRKPASKSFPALQALQRGAR